ncbi:hypothetical protein [Streptomyces sp. NPDC018031]|uniref:hypothetical protein n=1 Tax=Streptomyces sp. NPDC018031 TaxID=3365033 RepID=UPI00379CA292
MSDTPRSQDPAPGDGLVRLGAVVFMVGAVATMATVAPLLLGADPLPTAAYLVSMLMGVGFALAAAGMLRSIAAQRRQARSVAEASPAARAAAAGPSPSSPA